MSTTKQIQLLEKILKQSNGKTIPAEYVQNELNKLIEFEKWQLDFIEGSLV